MKFSSLSRFSRGGGGIRVIRVRADRVKMPEKWGEIQGEMDLVRVIGVLPCICTRRPGSDYELFMSQT